MIGVTISDPNNFERRQKMLAAKIITLLLLIGGAWLVVKYLIFPRLPEEQPIPEHLKILEGKLEKLQEMRDEYESVKMEKDVTGQMKEIDSEIENLIEEIKNIENA